MTCWRACTVCTPCCGCTSSRKKKITSPSSRTNPRRPTPPEPGARQREPTPRFTADDVGIDGGAASAEEAAVHVIDDEE
ncbi:DUF5709 domain-containing protein [Mycobacterium rhizamassiliense]|uniref:DUF5709 domain-containing protein n=1 Tax=Mycobacterium rhizamassiliense TaxID=1841860 RepID=UPI002481E30E|nr:DUF5709 domain-containing protein [Mycobacterium rhizamassiliense]